MSQYLYHQDPGHGWVEVSAEEVKRLGIAEKVSAYSYFNDGRVFLEEDCDASLFVNAKLAHGEPAELVEVYNERTPIRNFDSWRGQA